MTKSALAYAQTQERRRNLELERRERARADETEVAVGVAETVDLRRSRGEEIHTPQAGRGERAKPAYVLTGLDYLAKQKRLTPQQYKAGERYGKLYQMLETGDMKSCLGVLEIRGSGDYEPSQVKTFARLKLAEARQALNEHIGMVTGLDLICGLGLRPSEAFRGRRDYERLESQLDCALTILVKLWGM